MNNIAALQARLGGIGVNSLKSLLRRVVRWYLAPSGLLLLLASALLALAFLDWGPSWALGVAGVGLLTVFLTYRFSRQQGLLLRALENHQQTATAQLGGLRTRQTEIARALTGHSELLNNHIKSIEHQVQGLQAKLDNVQDLPPGLMRTQSMVAGLDYKTRVLGDGHQDLSERTRVLGDGHQDLIERIALTQARLDKLEHQASAFRESQRSVNKEFQHSVNEIESLADDARNQVVEPAKPELVESELLVADAVVAMRSDFALWAASTTNQSFNGVALVVSPERSGTTWAFDVLRSLPGASQVATSAVYRTLGIAGNRYPKHLIDVDPHGEPIELRDGVGGWLPRLRQPTFGHVATDLLAVEKVHPSAFNFEPTSLLRSLGQLEQHLGGVQMVLLIRDPVFAYRSFVSYQKSAGWHADVDTDSAAQFFASSLSAMHRLRQLHEGCLIVSYEDLIADPVGGYKNLADRLGLKTDETAVRNVVDAADQWRTQATKSAYFSSSREAKASQLVVGKGLPSTSEREALETARELYGKLWTDRTV